MEASRLASVNAVRTQARRPHGGAYGVNSENRHSELCSSPVGPQNSRVPAAKARTLAESQAAEEGRHLRDKLPL